MSIVRREALLPLLCMFLLLGSPGLASPQAEGDPVSLGTYRVVHSKILGEDRPLQVHLPRGYDESKLSYPVVFLFYSDWEAGYFAQTVNDLYHLTIDRMPEVILVGVPNVQRYRDFYPWPSETRLEAGHADTFLRALREEIIPFVETEYRTKPYRIMIGPQAAAVFGAYTLVEGPGTFQAFILNDPCRLDSPERSLCREVARVAAGRGGAGAEPGVFFAVGHDSGEERWPSEGLRLLEAGLTGSAAESFRWRIDLVPDWPFFLAPVTVRPALLDLFSGYPFPDAEEVAGLEEIQAHYGRLSASIGINIEPPSLVLTQAASGLREREEYSEALGVLTLLTELYPSSLDGPWQLGHLYRVMGDTATAIRYYEECLERNPNMVAAQQWLDRLRGGG
jgi:hypothetical protein